MNLRQALKLVKQAGYGITGAIKPAVKLKKNEIQRINLVLQRDGICVVTYRKRAIIGTFEGYLARKKSGENTNKKRWGKQDEPTGT